MKAFFISLHGGVLRALLAFLDLPGSVAQAV
jgi:hypothetical protein